jgi:hypothetical protein
MKRKTAGVFVVLVLVAAFGAAAQQKGTVEMEQKGPFRPGDPIVFNIKLDESLPKDARFDLRISPVEADEQISLGNGEPVKGSDKDFRISTKLPEAAFPGKWHVSIIYLFLPGAGWTNRTIAHDNVEFEVAGKPYAIPAKAEITVAH